MATKVTSIARTGRCFYAASTRVARHSLQLHCQTSRTQVNRHRLFATSATLRERKYTEEHEWVEFAADGSICTLGITNYAAKALGDITYVELPELDSELGAGDAIGAVESVKSASDVITPLAGTVVETNSKLEMKPSLLNRDPEGDGWIAKLKPMEGQDTAKLMNKEQYDKHTGEEEAKS